MRKVVLGLVLASVAMPTLATAQDESRPDRPQRSAEQRRDPAAGGDRREQGQRPAPAEARPAAPAAPPAPPAQQPAANAATTRGDRVYQGERRGDGQGYRDRGNPAAGQQFQQQQAAQRDQYRGAPGGGDPRGGDPRRDDRFAGRPPQGGPGALGYRAPGRPDGWNGGQGYERGNPGTAYRSAPPPGGGGWNRGWHGDRRYDWGRYRAENRNAFHLPRYYAPRGWGYGYRRFAPGITLSAALFGQSFWIDDPFDYRLPPAYGPYRWVRYYNDALLVDIRTGYVVDTVYDIFW